MKKHKLIKHILILVLIIVLLLTIPFCIKIYKVNKQTQSLLTGGFIVETEKEYKARLKTEQSDITGMTRYDKYKMGLDPEDESDTDQDGLTDREEIEIYHSDPKKQSTANDLYTDGYKVKHKMDLFTHYDYQDEIAFPYNECQEIILEANIPSDMEAFVRDITGSETITGYTVYKEYNIYNYNSSVSIDVSDIMSKNKLNMNDIDILINDGLKLKRAAWRKSDNDIIKLKKTLTFGYVYNIYIVNKSRAGSFNLFLNGTDSTQKESQNTGNAIIFGSPLISLLSNNAFDIYYEKEETKEETELLKTNMIQFKNETFSMNEMLPENEKIAKEKDIATIDIVTSYLRNLLPDFEYTDNDSVKWWMYLYCYYRKDGTKEESISDGKQGFDIYVDELPFQNFGSYISEGGNCAGIAHITSVLYNTGTNQRTEHI